METRIIFLIIALFSLFFIFSKKGQEYLRVYVGLDIRDKNEKDIAPDTNKKILQNNYEEKDVYGGGLA